jgi:calcium permeable stress-gated cation channel
LDSLANHSYTEQILRPRWPELYAARKRRLEARIKLPELSNSFLGWMPKLWRVTDEQVLNLAGLDAFVFLNFFRMSTRLFATMAFLAIVVLLPINAHYRHYIFNPGGSHAQESDDYDLDVYDPDVMKGGKGGKPKDDDYGLDYLWSYVLFTFLFVGLTIYTINWETFRVIKLRQNYLGSQSTVTDRTFRLTGIPSDLRSEGRIKNLIEKLEIGTVESVTICREWGEIDGLIHTRQQFLYRLEAAWATYLKRQQKTDQHQWSRTDVNNHVTSSDQNDEENGENGENGRLLQSDSDQPHVVGGERPQATLRYGFLSLRSKKVDAIDYYEEKLRRYDLKVAEVRKKHFKPTDMAIVTMDSVASCQMVTQARIDPRPGRLLTKPTPSPSDIVWSNTYALRGIRRLQSWTVTIFITFLTLVWIFPTAFLASWLSICTIRNFLPGFVEWLTRHSIIKSLLQNGLPTLVVSLLNVAVPYLYDWLSNCQGMISQGDVELSVISKNFFFTFFNTFFVFAVSRTGFDFWSALRDLLKDTSKLPEAIAEDVEGLGFFYISFIMLQGIGLMPFRICEVGSVTLFPFSKMMSKTPRDFAELRKPPTFQYGFFLPTALLVFNLCLIYSVLRTGFAILIVGTIYFSLGSFAYKYMVLYAMDQPQHATGGAWRIICYRIVVGLLVFEVVMIGQIASLGAWLQSICILPLLPFTIWYSYYFKRRFEPLTRYIALRAIRRNGETEESAILDDDEDHLPERPRSSQALLRRGSTLDEYKEMGLSYVNPSLVMP